MKLVPLPQEQLQPTVQTALSFLESDDAKVPGSMNDAIVSAKSLFRAILSGQLVLCQKAPPEPAQTVEAEPAPKEEPKKRVSNKKKAA
jgi:hypothetical protein